MNMPSLEQSRYILLFEYDFSPLTFDYLLKTKEQTMKYFKEFKVLAKNQRNKKIKNLRTEIIENFVILNLLQI